MAGGSGPWLLLGAGGFIGTQIRCVAAAAGVQVVGASRSDPADLRCDLTDSESVDRAIATVKPVRVINAAGPPSVAHSWTDPADSFRQHALGVLHLLEAARRHTPGAHLTLLSSAEVYGSSERSMDETAPIEPLTPYGAAKAAMEVLCRQHARAHGTELAILRLFNQVGPGLAPGHAIADFAATVAAAERRGNARALLRVANPDAVRDYTDVRDAARAIVAVAEHRLTDTFNLCSGEATSTTELIGILAKAAGIPVDFESDRSLIRPRDPSRKVGRPERLQSAIDWRPAIPLEQTVVDILAAARGSDASAG